jgi:hypothetical protein
MSYEWLERYRAGGAAAWFRIRTRPPMSIALPADAVERLRRAAD